MLYDKDKSKVQWFIRGLSILANWARKCCHKCSAESLRAAKREPVYTARLL